jgi:hypothetical protein
MPELLELLVLPELLEPLVLPELLELLVFPELLELLDLLVLPELPELDELLCPPDDELEEVDVLEEEVVVVELLLEDVVDPAELLLEALLLDPLTLVAPLPAELGVVPEVLAELAAVPDVLAELAVVPELLSDVPELPDLPSELLECAELAGDVPELPALPAAPPLPGGVVLDPPPHAPVTTTKTPKAVAQIFCDVILSSRRFPSGDPTKRGPDRLAPLVLGKRLATRTTRHESDPRHAIAAIRSGRRRAGRLHPLAATGASSDGCCRGASGCARAQIYEARERRRGAKADLSSRHLLRP